MKLNTSSQVKQSSECAAKQMKSIWSSVKSGKTKNIQQIPLALLVRGGGLSIMAYWRFAYMVVNVLLVVTWSN